VQPIDYTCENRKEVGELRGDLGAIIKVLTLLNPYHHKKKTEPFSQEMHLKIPLLSRGLELSNQFVTDRL
jgi:hypothetical protein